MALNIQAMKAPLGAEVTGIDLGRPVDAATRDALYRAWIEHAVLVIRDQHLEPPQFAAAARLFGDLLEQQLKKFSLAEYPDVGTISSRDLPLVDGKLHVRGESSTPTTPASWRRLRRSARRATRAGAEVAFAACLRKQPEPAQDGRTPC